jgi:hypothetical protein
MLGKTPIRGRDIQACVSIAMFFDTAYGSLEIPPHILRQLARIDVAVEVTAYPCSAMDAKKLKGIN